MIITETKSYQDVAMHGKDRFVRFFADLFSHRDMIYSSEAHALALGSSSDGIHALRISRESLVLVVRKQNNEIL